MKKRSFIYIIVAGLLWGTSGIFVHYLAPHGITSLQMTAVRAAGSFMFIFLYILFTNRELFKTQLCNMPLFIVSGITIFVTAASYYKAMQSTSISTAVVLMYMAPVFVLIFSVIFWKETFSFLKGTAIVLMLAGCGLVSGIIGGIRFDTLGIFFGFLSAVSYAAYNIITKIIMHRQIHPLTATVYSFMFMSLFAVFSSHPLEIIKIAGQNPIPCIPLYFGLGFFTCVAPYFLYTLALKELPAGTASALGIVEPMAATVYSVVFFHEALNFFSTIGIVLILGSILLLSKSEK